MVCQAISNLYREDQRRGDGFVAPLRRCGEKWSQLGMTLDPARSRCAQVARRVASVVPLIFVTLACAMLSVPGVLMKAFQRIPPPLVRGSLDVYNDRESIQLYRTKGPLQKNTGGVNIAQRLCFDVLEEVSEYFGIEALSDFRRTCKAFNGAGSRAFRHRALARMELSLWGAVDSHCSRLMRKEEFAHYYQWSPTQLTAEKLGSIQHQLDAYERFKPECDRDMDYFARLMPGGPVAFECIPTPNFADARALTLDSLTHPISRGIDQLGQSFFALRLKVTVQRDEAYSLALIFVRIDRQWVQHANSQMRAGTVQLVERPHINLVLHLLQKDMDTEDRALFAKWTDKPTVRSVSVE